MSLVECTPTPMGVKIARRMFARMIAGGMSGYSAWGENIARGQQTPAAVMASWMGSQGHRENILRAIFTHMGVGVHSTNDIWWTQLFVTR